MGKHDEILDTPSPHNNALEIPSLKSFLDGDAVLNNKGVVNER